MNPFEDLVPEKNRAKFRQEVGTLPSGDYGAFNDLVPGNTQVPQSFATSPSQSFYKSKIVEPLSNFSTGFAKGTVSTIKGLTQVGETIGKAVLPKSMEAPSVYSEDALQKNKEQGGFTGKLLSKENLTPEGTAQKLGYGAEKVAELFAPGSKVSKAEKGIDLLIQGAGFLPRAGRVLAKSGINALATGSVVAAQTGSLKEGAKAGAIAGGIRGGLATIGEGARALKIPERLYSTIFKNSAKDMLTELRSGGIQALQKNNPEKFQDLVTKGIIKISKDGTPLVNDTLAEQALDKGLRGSIRGMANEVVQGALDNEDKVQTIARTYKGTVGLNEPQFQNVLRKIAGEYEDVGFGEVANEANKLADTLKSTRGKVSGETAIKIKRFLDRVRIASSFDKPVVNLSTSQGNLKTLADAVRTRVNKIPGMGTVMKDYSFNLEALEALAKEASRRGNNQVLSLIDSLFLSGAYAGNNPIPGVTMGMVRKTLQSAPGATYLGQTLKNPSLGALSPGLLSVGSAGGRSLISDLPQ